MMTIASALARVLIALVLGPSGSARSDVIQVPADHATIQSAIHAATSGDEMLVAPGSHDETIDVKGKAIALLSRGGELTVIDGSGLNQSVVRCASGEGSDTVRQGFTIIRSAWSFGKACGSKAEAPRSTTVSLGAIAPATKAAECTTILPIHKGFGRSESSVLSSSVTARKRRLSLSEFVSLTVRRAAASAVLTSCCDAPPR